MPIWIIYADPLLALKIPMKILGLLGKTCDVIVFLRKNVFIGERI